MSRAVLMNGADRPEVMLIQDASGDRAWAAIPDDALSGTDGDDRVFFSSPDPMDGGAGFDTVDFSYIPPQYAAVPLAYYSFLNPQTLRPGATSGVVEVWYEVMVRGGAPLTLLSGSFTNFEQIVLGYNVTVALGETTQDWTIIGHPASFANIATGSGNDILIGGLKDGVFSPGGGSNTVTGGVGDDTVRLNVAYADSVITYSGGTLRIQTGLEVNVLTGVEHVIFTDRALDLALDGAMAPAIRRVDLLGPVRMPFTTTADADIMVGWVGSDVIDGQAGDDWLYGATGDDTLKGGGGNDYIDGGTHSGVTTPLLPGVDIAVFEGNFADYSFSLSNGIWTVSGAASGTDRVVNIETFRFADRSITVGPNGLVQTGTEGADTLTGTAGPDELSGLGGDDRLDAGSVPLTNTAPITTVINANDILRGGAGNDILTSQGISNGSILDGGDGDDVITAAWSGTSQLQQIAVGGLSATFYRGVSGDAVTILGGAGADRIRAFSNAVIDGGSGDDVISLGTEPELNPFVSSSYSAGTVDAGLRATGGAGADTFIITNPLQAVLITDFEVSIDRLDLAFSFGPATQNITNRLILAQQGADTLILSADGSRTYARLLNVDASSIPPSIFLRNTGAESYTGYIDPLRLYTLGTEAADVISNATLALGMGGDDVISAANAPALLYGGAGTDWLTGSISADTLDGGLGNDLLVGLAGNDTLFGGRGNDRIQGGLGADLLWGGDGLSNSNEADVFIFQSAADSTAEAYDIIRDFEFGRDTIELTALTISRISIVRTGTSSSFVFVTTASGTLQFGAVGAVNGNNLLYAATQGVYLAGATDQTNRLEGGSRDDIVVGGTVDDIIRGGGGADLLTGGLGADIFRYTATSDSTSAAYDVITDFATGSDRIDLTGLNATSISVIRSGGSSFVYAETPAGGFQLIALNQAVNGNDFVYGGSHGVYLIGSADADILRGTSLADPIAGGAGNDTITGGGGADALFGDAGADTLVYVAASDSTVAAADGIFGFVSGQDRIDLTGVRTGASDTFGIAYLGTGSFLFVDLGGNGTNDMLIQLADTRLLASDIRWSASAGELEPGLKDAGPAVLPVEWVEDGDPVGPMTWTGRYMLDLDIVATAGLHHTPDWYL